MIDVLLNSLVPIFAVMALGFLAGWIRDVDNHHVAELNALVMDFALPASLFVATASTPRAVLLAQWPLLAVFVVSMLALYALSYWMQRRLFGLGTSEASVQTLNISLPNYAAAGLPLIAAVFGRSDTVYVALSIATGSIVLSPLTLAILEAHKAPAVGPKSLGAIPQAVGRSLCKPIVLGPLLGIAFSLLAIPLPKAASGSFQLIGQAAGGVALFLTGLILSAQRIELSPNVLSGTFLKNVVHPLLVVRLDPGPSHGPGNGAGGASAVRSALRLLWRAVRLALRHGVRCGRIHPYRQLARQRRDAAGCAGAHGGMVMVGLVAILCSGQGLQHPAMFDLVANCPEAEPVFAAAASVLGQDPRRFVRQSAPADLFSDLSGQILCCTQALAAWAALGTIQPPRAVIAGYSVGELAAWGCAGALDAPGTLRLAQRRAVLMDAAARSDGGLAAIVGLRRPTLEPILARHAVSIAIVDDVDSFVVGGRRTGLEAACQEAAARGARHTVSLKVALPSHTPLLGEATEQFRAVLREASPRLPRARYRLLSGIDGDTIQDIEAGIDKLARQISTTIDWAACLESCRSAGAEAALELGPGTALSRMASVLFPDGRARAVEEFRTLAGLRTWLERSIC